MPNLSGIRRAVSKRQTTHGTHGRRTYNRAAIACTIFLARSGCHSGRTARWILVRFGVYVANNCTKFHTDLMNGFDSKCRVIADRYTASPQSTVSSTIFVSAFWLLLPTNPTIDFHEIRQGCVVCIVRYIHQISYGSNERFLNADRYTAN